MIQNLLKLESSDSAVGGLMRSTTNTRRIVRGTTMISRLRISELEVDELFARAPEEDTDYNNR